ncbi:MAG: hypothetical protein K0S56_248 [Microvirga sp.]|nr:hypothetical protein [Microvirga sp.]
MFFTLSKVVWALLAPSNLLVLTMVVGAILALRRRRLGLILAAFGLVGLVIGGLSPLTRLALSTLEDRFPAFVDDGRPVDGVVVLGGAENPYISGARGQPSFSDSAERIFALGDLARRYPQAKLVFTGANSSLLYTPEQTESDTVRAVLPSLGLAPERVMFEDRARNTAENARYVMDMVRPKLGERWLVVTSAAHMPRAIGCFRAIGFEVIAYPVDYRTGTRDTLWRSYRTIGEGLADLDGAAREWLGLVAYRITGRISTLFPAP